MKWPRPLKVLCKFDAHVWRSLVGWLIVRYWGMEIGVPGGRGLGDGKEVVSFNGCGIV